MPSYSKDNPFSKHVNVNLSLSDDQIDEFYDVFLNYRSRNGRLRLDVHPFLTQRLMEIFEEYDIHVTEEEEKSWLSKLDLEDRAHLTFPEFTQLLARKMLEAEVEDEIKQLYKIFDVENKGYVTAKDLRTVLITLNPRINDDDVEEIMMDADTDQDGVLNY